MKNKETYKQARARLLDELKTKGWEVKSDLKTPWAKKGDKRLDFNAQSVYMNGHSLFLDIRGIDVGLLEWFANA